MKQRYSKEQVLRILRDKQDGRTQKQLAKEIGCVESYVSDVLKKRREPGPKILAYLGLIESDEYIKQG